MPKLWAAKDNQLKYLINLLINLLIACKPRLIINNYVNIKFCKLLNLLIENYKHSYQQRIDFQSEKFAESYPQDYFETLQVSGHYRGGCYSVAFGWLKGGGGTVTCYSSIKKLQRAFPTFLPNYLIFWCIT
jgi:hypothetical protein